ncbi:hypothetical protein E2P81_ATG03843 [Venturia nashicola]|nr:hypothetical protein E2P81_ATG03843 [Venturia nashicola]
MCFALLFVIQVSPTRCDSDFASECCFLRWSSHREMAVGVYFGPRGEGEIILIDVCHHLSARSLSHWVRVYACEYVCLPMKHS